MKRLYVVALLCFVTVGRVTAAPRGDAFQNIDDAVRLGRLAKDDAIALKMVAATRADLLPEDLQSDEALRCGTPEVVKLLAEAKSAGEATQRIVDYLKARPQDRKLMTKPVVTTRDPQAAATISRALDVAAQTTVNGWEEYDTTHFAMYYQLTGTNASTLAYAQQLGGYFETSWSVEVNDLHYQAPTTTLGRTEVYIYDMTSIAVTYPAITGSYIQINRDMSKFNPKNTDPVSPAIGLLKVTTAHEFQHCIQFETMGVLAAAGEGWWMEGTATYIEDVVFNEVNDYVNWLKGAAGYYSHLSESINSIGKGYASNLLPRFLQERYGGPDVPRQVLEGVGLTTSAEESMQAVLASHGTSLTAGFQDFGLWNFFTGARTMTGSHYAEASTYPLLAKWQKQIVMWPTTQPVKTPAIVQPLAFHYAEIVPTSPIVKPRKLTVKIAASRTGHIRGWVVTRRKNGTTDIAPVSMPPVGASERTITINNFGWNTVGEVVVILSNGSIDTPEQATYTVEIERPLDVDFCVDTTGSMWDGIWSIKATIGGIFDYLDQKGTDFRIAVTEFKDWPFLPYGYQGDFPYRADSPFSNVRSVVDSGINKLFASGGGDIPEAQYSGIMGGVSANGIGLWRWGAKKAIIVFTDAAAHDPEPFSGLTKNQVLFAAKNAAVDVPILDGTNPWPFSVPVTPAATTATPTSTKTMHASSPASRPRSIVALDDNAPVPDPDPDYPVNIYCIIIRNDPAAIDSCTALALGSGGKVFTASNPQEISEALLDAIADISGGNTNRPPDVSAAYATPNRLWPVDSKFTGVNILGVTDPDGDAVTITITGITQDEPVNKKNSGNREADASGVGTSTARLRAQRSGAGDSRVYRITFEASDGKGGTATGTVSVCVPHDQNPNTACQDSGLVYDSTVP